jgi:hypothetical protein
VSSVLELSIRPKLIRRLFSKSHTPDGGTRASCRRVCEKDFVARRCDLELGSALGLPSPHRSDGRSLPVAKRAMPAPLFATRAAVPQGASGLYEQTRDRIEITGVAIEQGAVMGIDDLYVLTPAARVQAVGMGDEANR